VGAQVATWAAGRQRNAPQTSLQLVAWSGYDFKFDLFLCIYRSLVTLNISRFTNSEIKLCLL